MNSEATLTLISMGFNEAQARDALSVCSSNLDRAIDFLLGGGGATADATCSHNTSSSAATDRTIVHSEVSQYSLLSSKSACTSIALTLASRILSELRVRTTNNDEHSLKNIITSSFLNETIMQGMKSYDDLQKSNSLDVEHLSVEEILRLSAGSNRLFTTMKLLEHSPRQGILSSSTDNPIGLQSILSACRSDASNEQSYVAVVVTKPPETVLIMLPPLNATAAHQNYVLLDSHPRPSNFTPHHPSGSYALFHSDLQSLVRSLEEIFPVVDLGSDVNEMMAMMYNSFDVYPFEII
eukprot:scaffold25888_cov49-Cyclotella_meneghiniana.AAC.3